MSQVPDPGGIVVIQTQIAAVLQTANICIFQLWQGSRISLLIQKEGVA